VGAAYLKLLSGFGTINTTLVKLAEDLQKEGGGEAFSQLFFSHFKMSPKIPLVERLRRPALRSGLLSPSTKGIFLSVEYLSPFELAPCLLLFPPR